MERGALCAPFFFANVVGMTETSIHDIQNRIAIAARNNGRDARDVELVAVSKNQSDEKIDAALRAGLRVFGENRVQEAQRHWADRRNAWPGLALHLIGPLQTNKVRDAVRLFDVIQTIDREKLALALGAEMRAQNRNLPCFIQVNIGAEDQKSGCAIDDIAALLHSCRDGGVDVVGLMAIPPVDDDPAPYFKMLRDLAAQYGLEKISMGMSSDFELAIAHGATHVRVGTALFGTRPNL